MNRRSFLKRLGLGVAAAAVAPVAFANASPAAYHTYLVGKDAVMSDADYYRSQREKSPGWVSYRVHYTVTLPPNHAGRIRFIDSTKAVS